MPEFIPIVLDTSLPSGYRLDKIQSHRHPLVLMSVECSFDTELTADCFETGPALTCDEPKRIAAIGTYQYNSQEAKRKGRVYLMQVDTAKASMYSETSSKNDFYLLGMK